MLKKTGLSEWDELLSRRLVPIIANSPPPDEDRRRRSPGDLLQKVVTPHTAHSVSSYDEDIHSLILKPIMKNLSRGGLIIIPNEHVSRIPDFIQPSPDLTLYKLYDPVSLNILSKVYRSKMSVYTDIREWVLPDKYHNLAVLCASNVTIIKKKWKKILNTRNIKINTDNVEPVACKNEDLTKKFDILLFEFCPVLWDPKKDIPPEDLKMWSSAVDHKRKDLSTGGPVKGGPVKGGPVKGGPAFWRGSPATRKLTIEEMTIEEYSKFVRDFDKHPPEVKRQIFNTLEADKSAKGKEHATRFLDELERLRNIRRRRQRHVSEAASRGAVRKRRHRKSKRKKRSKKRSKKSKKSKKRSKNSRRTRKTRKGRRTRRR